MFIYADTCFPKSPYDILNFALDRTLDAFLNRYVFPQSSPIFSLLYYNYWTVMFLDFNVQTSNKQSSIPFNGQNLLVDDALCKLFYPQN